MSKKPNGKTKPTVYAEREGLPDDLFSALDSAIKHGKAEHQDRKIESRPSNTLEAAIIRPREGVTMLYTGMPYPGRKPPTLWRPTARFDDRTFLDKEHVQARPIRTDLGAPVLAALECAMGRDGLALYGMDDEREKAERVDLEGVCELVLQSGSRNFYAKYKGLWFGCGVIRKAEQPPSPRPDPAGGQAYPDLPIL